VGYFAAGESSFAVAVFVLSIDIGIERAVLWWRVDTITNAAVGCNQGRS
jgi:hypothetical protein